MFNTLRPVQRCIVGHTCFRIFRSHSTAQFETPAALKNDRFKRRRAFVSASEIANLINLNPHVPAGDAVERLWEKNNGRTFKEALVRNNLQSFTQEDRLKELGLLDLATAIVDVDDAKQYQQGLKIALTQTTDKQDRKIVKDFVNTARGTKHEKMVFETLKLRDPEARVNTDTNLYQRTINIPNTDIKYLISGYIDGIEARNQRIIEIKARQNRLFNHVPLYEQVQCQAYLYLTGLTICEHIESFRGTLQSTTLTYDPVFWNHVLERLNKVILAFDALVKNSSIQDAFLETKDLFASADSNRV